jgi:hypothetical protein
MSAQHGVILIHGIGDQGPDWATAVAERLRQDASAHAGRVLGRAPAPADELVAVHGVHWADILQAPQQQLLKILQAHQLPARLEGNMLRRLWNQAKHWLRQEERRFVTEFVGDVIGYLEPAAREAIHARIDEALEAFAALVEVTEKARPLTIVAHSLGTVIVSDYLRPRLAARRARHQRGFHHDWRLENVFTIGSPLALFSLRYGGPEIFTDPPTIEGPRGRWVNIYDKDDPIAMPIKMLNEAYGRAVLQDVQVDSGDYLLAHNGYFTHADTLQIMTVKIVLDAIAASGGLPAKQLTTLYAEYDRSLGL